MITNKDSNIEISAIDELVKSGQIKDKYQVANLKLMSLILKMLMSMRTNQTLIMDKQGVKKVEPLKRDPNASQDK
uniref:Uncharacterized protein n=1 Tax=viral metagenome TaxID=1070528 RepID=A0A6M3KZ89_9ZZZZ